MRRKNIWWRIMYASLSYGLSYVIMEWLGIVRYGLWLGSEKQNFKGKKFQIIIKVDFSAVYVLKLKLCTIFHAKWPWNPFQLYLNQVLRLASTRGRPCPGPSVQYNTCSYPCENYSWEASAWSECMLDSQHVNCGPGRRVRTTRYF